VERGERGKAESASGCRRWFEEVVCWKERLAMALFISLSNPSIRSCRGGQTAKILPRLGGWAGADKPKYRMAARVK